MWVIIFVYQLLERMIDGIVKDQKRLDLHFWALTKTMCGWFGSSQPLHPAGPALPPIGVLGCVLINKVQYFLPKSAPLTNTTYWHLRIKQDNVLGDVGGNGRSIIHLAVGSVRPPGSGAHLPTTKDCSVLTSAGHWISKLPLLFRTLTFCFLYNIIHIINLNVT